jgi:2-polyprenyl-3-methyl-5-hydroxy-6-metoxy-1,4-benzoquinol methylase
VINDYVGVFGQPQEFYTRAKADHLRRILDAKGGTKTLDVLDIGCGHGLIHSYLRDAGCRLTGIDVAENAIEMARRRSGGIHTSTMTCTTGRDYRTQTGPSTYSSQSV